MPCHVGHTVSPNHGHGFDYQVDFDARKLYQHFSLENVVVKF